MKSLSALLPLLALLCGCATVSPETRIRNTLVDVGLSRPVAGCMAERMVDRLSLGQLRKLGSLSKLRKAEIETMTVEEFLHRTRALSDPEILRVVTTAGIGCAIAA